MFHCDGWTFTWAVTAACATHVCLRKVEPAPVFSLIQEHRVTHMCGAPIVLNMLANAPEEVKVRFDHKVEIATGGAAPPSAVIEAMENDGFRVTHLYGLTECYGPATVCDWQPGCEDLEPKVRAGKLARQGVRYLTLEEIQVGVMVVDTCPFWCNIFGSGDFVGPDHFLRFVQHLDDSVRQPITTTIAAIPHFDTANVFDTVQIELPPGVLFRFSVRHGSVIVVLIGIAIIAASRFAAIINRRLCCFTRAMQRRTVLGLNHFDFR